MSRNPYSLAQLREHVESLWLTYKDLSFCATAMAESYSRCTLSDPRLPDAIASFRRSPAAYLARLVRQALPSGCRRVNLLLSGGEDSCFILDVLRTSAPPVEVTAYMVVTRNNGKDAARAREMCKVLGARYVSVRPNAAMLTQQLNTFVNRVGRLPWDPAQPLHNYACSVATEDAPDVPIVDGQFCDSVLHSNPHNHLLYWYERLPILRAVTRIAVRFVPRRWESRLGRRMAQMLHFTSARSPEDFIARTSRVKCSSKERECIRELISRYGFQTALSGVCYWGLTRKRERDKYRVVSGEIVLPFDDEKLFWIASECVDMLLGAFLRKRPIHNHLRSRFPMLFLRQRTLPFG